MLFLVVCGLFRDVIYCSFLNFGVSNTHYSSHMPFKQIGELIRKMKVELIKYTDERAISL